jgi:XTP/dITP diphosphohydrolase
MSHMKTFFICTSNKGKQKEIEKYAQVYGSDVQIIFPDESNELTVDESGVTFEENALLKAAAYKASIGNDEWVYVGDDSGITIPALGGEPGVFTRRWAGYEMTDEEILQYCMDKMVSLRGDERKAVFQTVLAVVGSDATPQYLHGKMDGRILEQPLEGVELQPGFPFRSIFWVDGVNMPMFQLHSLSPDERKGFLTHREAAFRQLFKQS